MCYFQTCYIYMYIFYCIQILSRNLTNLLNIEKKWIEAFTGVILSSDCPCTKIILKKFINFAVEWITLLEKYLIMLYCCWWFFSTPSLVSAGDLRNPNNPRNAHLIFFSIRNKQDKKAYQRSLVEAKI